PHRAAGRHAGIALRVHLRPHRRQLRRARQPAPGARTPVAAHTERLGAAGLRRAVGRWRLPRRRRAAPRRAGGLGGRCRCARGRAAAPPPGVRDVSGVPASGRRHAPVAVIALNELRPLARDPTALFFSLVLPVIIMVIIGTTFGAEGDLEIGVLDRDGSDRSADLVGTLSAADRVTVERYRSLDGLERDVRTGAVDAGVVVPPGYGAAIDAGRVARVA